MAEQETNGAGTPVPESWSTPRERYTPKPKRQTNFKDCHGFTRHFKANAKVNWNNEIENVKAMVLDGQSFEAIGRAYGVSKQRVKQVCQQAGFYESARKARKTERDEAFRLKHGDKRTTDKLKYSRLKAKFRLKKANAIRIGVEWAINFGELEFPDVCPVLGISIDYFGGDVHNDNSPSFDRLDCTKGYVPGNVVVMSWRANRIKNNGTAEEHERIATFMRQWKKGP